jgi:hypothetical protein
MAAAVASGGISIDSILQAAVRLLREAGRRRRPLEFGAGAGTLARRLHARLRRPDHRRGPHRAAISRHSTA